MSRRSRRLAIAFAVVHTLLIAAYTLPASFVPARPRYWSQAYARVLFHQDWRLFAPDPPRCSCALEVQRGPDEWIDLRTVHRHFIWRRMVANACRYAEASPRMMDGDTIRIPTVLARSLAQMAHAEVDHLPALARMRLRRGCALDDVALLPIDEDSPMSPRVIRLFQIAACLWLAGYVLSILLLGHAAWTNAPVDVFRSTHGPGAMLQAIVNGFSPAGCALLCVLVTAFSAALIVRHRWWLALIAWFLFRVITHRTWLASNGGVQLMENMLLWSALMTTSSGSFIPTFAFWAARLQLLLVYAVAAAHKFTGTAWLDGSALMTVAHDSDFHLHWLTAFPLVCQLLTYATLGFMSLFALVVWWTPSRRAFLLIGVLFHLGTSFFMGIPQMGLAFIACYALWLNEEEAAWIAALPMRLRARFG